MDLFSEASAARLSSPVVFAIRIADSASPIAPPATRFTLLALRIAALLVSLMILRPAVKLTVPSRAVTLPLKTISASELTVMLFLPLRNFTPTCSSAFTE